MSEVKKPVSKNTIVFVFFAFSLILMGAVTWGVSHGYIEIPGESGQATSASKKPLDDCSEIGECLKDSPMDKSAIQN